MKRIDAIRNIMQAVTDEIVVSSCGKISREVFFVKDRPRNFYNMGAMGCTLPLAMGIALCTPSKRVVVIIGDGEALMGLDSLVLLKKVQERYIAKGIDIALPFLREEDNQEEANRIMEECKFNLDLYILDNGRYDSTGGQRTISDCIDFRCLCDCKVIYVKESEQEVPRIALSHKEIKERFVKAIGDRVVRK